MNVFLRTSVVAPMSLGVLCFNIHSVIKCFQFPTWFLSFPSFHSVINVQFPWVCILPAASFVVTLQLWSMVFKEDTSAISVLLCLLRLALYPNMWAVLEKCPWAAEKKVDSLVLEWNILKVSVKSSWFLTAVSSSISLHNFCPICRMLKSSAISLWGSACDC